MLYKIAILPGDGIGPEVVHEGLKVLNHVGEKFGHKFSFQETPIGGQALDAVGEPLPEKTIELCRNSDAVLLGAVGGPKWDNNPPDLKPEKGLLGIRKELGLFANLRPARLYPSLVQASSLKPELLNGVDILVIRELTGGLYFGTPRGFHQNNGEQIAVNTLSYSESEVKRIAKIAFEAARKRKRKVCSVDKANVLETSQLWRRVVTDVGRLYPDVELSHMYVDNCAMQLIRNPKQFDVIVTENMFGDILSDEAAMLTGSIGMLPSASLGGKIGLYEPVHGSAPDIVGQGKANPIATIASVAMMLKYSFNLEKEADSITDSIEKILQQGYRTADIYSGDGKLVKTAEMGDLITKNV